jgi:glycolate oxidase FAD binding subunit
MPSVEAPRDPDELARLVRDAGANGRALRIVGGGTKAAYGRPVAAPITLRLDAFAGIVSYEPEEMVLVAGAATPLAEIEAALAEHRQMLAFEPPDWAPLWGAAGRATLGGTVACNLSGSRRFKSGAARDHLLGLDGVTGAGEVFKAGGRVVKNVTGYDLAKLFAGSMGTLAIATRLVLRAVPAPETTLTLDFPDLDAAAAVALLGRAAASPLEPSGLAHLPAALDGATSRTLIRLEGTAVSVAARAAGLASLGPAPARLDGAASRDLWRGLGAGAPLAAGTDDLWRVSLPPASGARFAGRVAAGLAGTRHYLDWVGCLVWLAVPAAPDAHAPLVRAALAAEGGGHATLVRAADDVRAAVPPFEPEAPALAALAARVKTAFDPSGVLEPGRMVAGR